MVFAAGDDFYRIVFTVFLLFTTTFLAKVDKVFEAWFEGRNFLDKAFLNKETKDYFRNKKWNVDIVQGQDLLAVVI